MEIGDFYILTGINTYLIERGYLKGDIIYVDHMSPDNRLNGDPFKRVFTHTVVCLQGTVDSARSFILEDILDFRNYGLKLDNILLEALFNYHIVAVSPGSFDYRHDPNNTVIPNYYGRVIRNMINARNSINDTPFNPLDLLRDVDKKSKSSKEEVIKDSITNDLIVSLFKYIPVKYQYCDAFYDIKTNKLLFYDGEEIRVITQTITDFRRVLNLGSLLRHCKFKIKSYETSGKLFQNTNFKKTLVGGTYQVEELLLQTEVKRSTELQNTLYIVTPEGRTRFVLEDIEIIYPNVSGYNIPKDRTIKKGSTVRVINDKHMKFIKKNDTVKVENIKKVGAKVYAAIKVNNNIVYERLNKFKIC